jgi:ribose/xylose/arabinose/galactoside ABC-type transport system permease subunit
MDIDIERKLTDQERKFITRAGRRRNLFLLSSIATVVVAVAILVYHGLIIKDMNGPRFVITLLLLLSGRSYLRLYKSATIFSKFQPEPATGQGRN